ncbi:hypothetical protein Pcar_3110 [Syntrophotalea carbinolica DSM 2380]|uniref:Uncharacterized protein n=1 Tax=Syntrophotalea carbinolica (strain DSM 2380 / NBRC 103641 / GraBd1) TaxID=338963 RepID=Q39ZW2_SYNC1|nr:DUF5752 family protein [Syntrophotalea carbinolica]ABA90345.1 hypothetical protein Pcar_3110 [Syntrophotalea carbinolica DSM 2380]
MATATSNIAPFEVKDCALITLSTGTKVQNLKEFRDALERVPIASIDHHFWGRLLRPQFDEPEYNNDFASWAYRGLHDKTLAERLSMTLPTDFPSLEALRLELVDTVEQRLDESEMIPWARADNLFYFLHSKIVVFDTGLRFDNPKDLTAYLPTLSTGCIFYHFIDARSRTEQRCDDFSAWLGGFGECYRNLQERLSGFDPYFSSLDEIRTHIATLFQAFFEEQS